jgi:hypothetical protein
MTTPVRDATKPADPLTQTCDVCAHPDIAHDDIARRFCKATMAGALSRGCICSPLET